MKSFQKWISGLLAAALLAGCGTTMFEDGTQPAAMIFVGPGGAQSTTARAVRYEELPAPAGLNAPIRPLPGIEAEAHQQPKPPIADEIAASAYGPRVAPPTPTPVFATATGGNDWLPAVGAANPAPVVETSSGPSFAWAETENFLILGTDRRGAGGSWRTDSIMVVGIDRANSRVAVLSVPRDLWVQIPGSGWSRINTADYIGESALTTPGGGPALISQILYNTFGVQTHHWVRVEMNGFVDIVNAVGGVDVTLDCPFYEPIFNLTTNQWDYFTLPAGKVHLDGESAYWFVRLRMRESDIGRAKRQRTFLWALRDQALNANLLVRFPELWSAFQNTISTDLSLLQMIELARFGLELEAANVRAAGLSYPELGNWTTAEGASVLRIVDPARAQGIVDGIWNAPAMADAYRQDATACPALPPGVDVSIAETPGAGADPDQTAVDPNAAPPMGDPNGAPPAEVVAAPVDPNAPPAGETILLPTPTPGVPEVEVLPPPEAAAPEAAAPIEVSLLPTPTPGP